MHSAFSHPARARFSGLLPLLFLAPSLWGQTSPSQAAPASGDQVVQMSSFEVSTTQGHGYVATNADAGFKTVQALIDIPQDIQVITRDLIDDIGATDSSLLLQYFGTGQSGLLGESVAMRGGSAKYPYVDDQPNNGPYGDNFFIDSYVVVRGEAQVLYLNAAAGGAVLKYTKKPLPYEQELLNASITSWGGTRVVADVTGPIGQVGEAKLGYRVVALQQGPGDYFYNDHESHQGIFPVFAAQIGNTVIRGSYIWQREMHVSAGTALITPTGKLYTGGDGPRDINLPPDDYEEHEERRIYLLADDKASENWEFRMSGSGWHWYRYNPIVEPNAYNWATQTLNFFSNLREITDDYWTILGDGVGKYHIATLQQQDNFGYGYTDDLIHHYTPPSPDFVTGKVNLPMGSQAAVDTLRVPAVSEYPPLGAPGSTLAYHDQTYVSSLYWQHTMDIVPNYLTAVAGWTWETISTDNAPNVAAVPYTATVLAASEWLHRVGFVFHPIKQVSIYGLTSTGFNPQSGGSVLFNGDLAPPQNFQQSEIGLKTAFLEGRISVTFAAFKGKATNNVASVAGISPITGTGYSVLIGPTTNSGYDGDIELLLTPNWQVIIYGYGGDSLDQNGLPAPNSYDNDWSVFTRYAFPRGNPLKGLVVGGGARQVGGAYIGTSGINGYVFAPVPAGSTQVIKMQKGFDSQFFASYPITRRLTGRISATNLTDNHYPDGNQGAVLIDPSPPRTFSFELDLKY